MSGENFTPEDFAAIAKTADALRDPRDTEIIRLRSVLENYGRHFEWCDTRKLGAQNCTCGLTRELLRGPGQGRTAPRCSRLQHRLRNV